MRHGSARPAPDMKTAASAPLRPRRRRTWLPRAGAVLCAAILAACGSDSQDVAATPPPAVETNNPIVEASLDCSNLEQRALPIENSFLEAVEAITGRSVPRSAASLARQGGDAGPLGKSTPGSVTTGGLVVNIGLTRDDPQAAEAVGNRLSAMLGELRVPAALQVARVKCETGRQLDGLTAACYDLRLRVPSITEARQAQMKDLSRCNWAAGRLRADPAVGPTVTYAESKGYASGDSSMILFSLRGMLDEPTPVAAPVGTQRVASLRSGTPGSGPVGKAVTTVPVLYWTKPRQSSVVATTNLVRVPDYADGASASGNWVMYGFGATILSYSVKCLQAQFRNLATGETRLVGSGPSCTNDLNSNAYRVTLDGTKVAVGYALTFSSGTVSGVALAWGTPNNQVDTTAPDFLINVAPGNVVSSGSIGNGRPDFNTLSESATTEVLLGIGVNVSSGITQKTEWWGTLGAGTATQTDVWNGYTVEQLEAGITSGLNRIYDAVAATLTYQVFPGCDSTIPRMNFCGNLSASDSYSSSTWDSVCGGTCDAAYDTCKFGVDACKVACCYGCFFGKICSCSDPCSGVRTDCYNGCTVVVSGSAEIDVSYVRGLELLEFTSANVPFLSSPDSVSVDVSGVISPGLTAYVKWKLCQSGVCVGDTSPLSSSKVGANARGTVTAKACPSGPPALYMTISEIVITQTGLWGIDAFVDSIVGVVQDSLDWLAQNISDLFYYDLQGKYDAAFNSALKVLQDELNKVLVDTPLVSCSS
jgi:hypothetical protein